MRLRVLTNLTGPDFTLVAGDITDRFDGAAAEKLIAYRNAEIVADEDLAPAAPAAQPARKTNRVRRSGRSPAAITDNS